MTGRGGSVATIQDLVHEDAVSTAERSDKFSVYLPADLVRSVDTIARRRLTSRAAVIRALVADGVRREQVA